MFGVEGTDTLHFATCVKQLGAGLYEQLTRFVSEHRDTRLIIIDTLQKIREASGDRYSYASDYEMIGQLKHFADQTGIALLLVHHTRKQQADDKFDMISGTNGLLGAADGAFVLQKEKRTGNTCLLYTSQHIPTSGNGLVWAVSEIQNRGIEETFVNDFLKFGSYSNRKFANLINLNALSELLEVVEIERNCDTRKIDIVHDNISGCLLYTSRCV